MSTLTPLEPFQITYSTQLTKKLEAQALASFGISLSDYIYNYVALKLTELLKEVKADLALASTRPLDYPNIARALSVWMQDHEKKNSWLADGYNAYQSGDCMRLRSYSLLGIAPKEAFVAQYKIANHVGRFIHEALEMLLKAVSGLLVNQSMVKKDGTVYQKPAIEVALRQSVLPENQLNRMLQLNYKAKADFIIQGKNGPIMGDVKGNDEKTWGTDWHSPKIWHWSKQIATESSFYQDAEGRKVTHGLIFEVGRNTFETKEYLIDLASCEEFVEGELLEIEQAGILVKEGKLPSGQPWKGNCRFCPQNYKEACDVLLGLRK